MKISFLILLLSIPLLTFSQKDKYNYSYRLNLPDRSSFYFVETESVDFDETNNSTQSIEIRIVDEDNIPIYYIQPTIINSNGEKIKLTPNDDGIIKTDLAYDNYQFSIEHPTFSSFDKFISLSMRTKHLTIVLGKSYKLVIPWIHSKRPLTDKELIELTRQISNGNENPKLIKKGVCYLTYEI
ncbi:MAG: hypothetical protein KDC91_10150 [Flavobacteriaceae bacterium]|nr:hypothetical protein [Flavobacteriaceae bacterium]